MKKSHKKIGVIVLTGLAVTGSSLSQGFVAHAATNYRILNHNLLKNPDSMEIWDIFSFIYVQKNQNKHGYDAIYLGNSPQFIESIRPSSNSKHKHKILIPKRGKDRNPFLPAGQSKYFYLQFETELTFSEGLEQGILNPYKSISEGIIIKVGDTFFLLRFNLTSHERRVIPMKVVGQQFGFNILYGENNDWYGLYEMESYLHTRVSIREDLKVNKSLIKRLEERPRPEHVFPNVESFADALKQGHNIPEELTRYRVGDVDYILSK